MKLSLFRSRTSKIVRVFAQDPSTSAAVAGLAYNTAGLTAYYIREGDASSTSITLVNATVGTWTSGGFKEVDSTNMPGIYELHLPNACFSSGESVVVYVKHSSFRPILLEFELDSINYQDAVRLGLTALPAAAAAASGGLPTVDGSNGVKLSVGTGAGQVNVASGKVPATLASTDVTGNVPADIQTIKTQTITCGAPVTILASVGTAGTSVAQTGDSYARIGAAGVGLSNLGDARLANLDAAISSRSTYAGGPVASVTGNVGGNVVGSVGGVVASVTVGANSDKTGYSLSVTPPTAAEIVAAVLTDVANQTTAGSLGKLVALLIAALNGTSVFTAEAMANAPTGGPAPSVEDITDSVVAAMATAPVGSVASKTGFKLSSDGLDAVMIESGVNFRQSQSIVFAAMAGVTSGMDTNAPVIKGGGVNTTRITATTDESGNRLTVNLNLPS